MTDERPGEVLVVDDEPGIRQLYDDFLSDQVTVTTAESGKEALETISTETNVILLDRRMPGLAGEEVLNEIRAQGFECPVAMMTAIVPRLEIVEMDFDDYVIKPVSGIKLLHVVDVLLHWEQYDTSVKLYYATARKIHILKAQYGCKKLDQSDAYHELLATMDSLEPEVAEVIESLDSDHIESLAARVDLPTINTSDRGI